MERASRPEVALASFSVNSLAGSNHSVSICRSLAAVYRSEARQFLKSVSDGCRFRAEPCLLRQRQQGKTFLGARQV
jgi:hypothetical protein